MVLLDVWDLLPKEVLSIGRMIQMAVEVRASSIQAVLTTGLCNGARYCLLVGYQFY